MWIKHPDDDDVIMNLSAAEGIRIIGKTNGVISHIRVHMPTCDFEAIGPRARMLWQWYEAMAASSEDTLAIGEKRLAEEAKGEAAS